MIIEKYEIVREFRFVIEGLDFPIKARIVKILDETFPQQFSWQISHYYKPHLEAVGVHMPTSTSGITDLETERKLMMYVDAFTTFGLKENKDY